MNPKTLEALKASIAIALNDFFEAYDDAWSRLVKINGAPPPPRQKLMRYDDPKADDSRFDTNN